MEYGATIARLALDILNHKESGPVEVPVQIIERESSKIS
jgi:DNA-binding LacI/PurR family transcriptional regulator